MLADFDVNGELEQGIEFQHIRARIKNTLNLPVDTQAKLQELQLTQRDMFVLQQNRRMTLSLSSGACLTLEVQTMSTQLATFLHNGPPKMRYEYVGQISPKKRITDG